MTRRGLRALLAGAWEPNANPAFSWVRLLFVLQAAFRGTDYLTGHSSDAGDTALHGVVAAAPLHVWGALFYASAVVIVLGFAGRWLVPLVLGHLALFALYGGMGSSVLSELHAVPPIEDALAIVGAAIGAWALVTRRIHSSGVRLAVGLPLMILGQLAVASGLGTDYRLGTGFVISALVHLTFAVGTVVAWKRQALRDIVDSEWRNDL